MYEYNKPDIPNKGLKIYLILCMCKLVNVLRLIIIDEITK